MVEGKPSPQRGQRPLARYRFEYERKRSVWKLVLVGVTGACVVATVAGVSLALRPQEEVTVLASAKPPEAETPKPLAFVMAKPQAIGVPEDKVLEAPKPAAPLPPPPPMVMAKAPVERPARPREAPAAVIAVSRSTELAPAATPAVPAPEAAVVVAKAEPAAPAPEPAVQAAAAPDPCAAAAGVERMVCADPEVRAADQRLVAAFRRARQLADNPAALDRQQDRWRERRDRLGGDRAAVLAHYEQRYRQLWPSRRYPTRIGAQLPGVIPWF